MHKFPKRFRALSAAVLLGLSGGAFAENQGLTRTIVTKSDVSVPDREAIITRVEFAPGGLADWHTHPGDEMSYVAEGEVTVMVAGQAPRKYPAGAAFVIPAGVVHSARNESSAATRLVGVYLLEKGKPLATPAPAPAQ